MADKKDSRSRMADKQTSWPFLANKKGNEMEEMMREMIEHDERIRGIKDTVTCPECDSANTMREHTIVISGRHDPNLEGIYNCRECGSRFARYLVPVDEA